MSLRPATISLMDAHFPPLGHAALIERLAAIPPAGITVVTVNARLARTVIGEVDRAQVAAGRASWEAPDALPWGAFLARCHEEALYDPAGTSGPGLLKPAAHA